MSALYPDPRGGCGTVFGVAVLVLILAAVLFVAF